MTEFIASLPDTKRSVDAGRARDMWDLTYYPSPRVHTQALLGHFRNQKRITVGNADALVINDGYETIVILHETDDTGDVLQGADKTQIKTPYGHVHRGFYNHLHQQVDDQPSLYTQIMEEVNRHGQPVTLVGHSLGGATAQLLASEMISKGDAPPIKEIYTFGQPKAGAADNAAFLNARLDGRYFNIFHDNDKFHDYPFNNSYAHAGQMVVVAGAPDNPCALNISEGGLKQVREMRVKTKADGSVPKEIALAAWESKPAQYMRAITDSYYHTNYDKWLVPLARQQEEQARCVLTADSQFQTAPDWMRPPATPTQLASDEKQVQG